uniref:Uncharacterized protein n=1 Tax=Glossina pallidipes TaxID=7398 RepID=A0A1A9ZEB3_GLOPL
MDMPSNTQPLNFNASNDWYRDSHRNHFAGIFEKPRTYSDPGTGGIGASEYQHRRRSVEADFYKQPYRPPPPLPLSAHEIRQQRLAGRYHELRLVDDDRRSRPKEFDYTGDMNAHAFAVTSLNDDVTKTFGTSSQV